MRIGALIITTGLPKVSGVAALMPKVGAITAGQRMIFAFQRAGVALTGLVVGPEDKKAERQLAQNGVVFLRCTKENASFFQGIREGLSFFCDKFDRVFLVPGDMPLFLPRTLEALLKSEGNLAVPEDKCTCGYPVLLDRKAMSVTLAAADFQEAQKAVQSSDLRISRVCVDDVGILLRSRDMSRRQKLIQQHNAQLTRSIVEVSLHSGGALYDPRLAMLLHLVEDTKSVRDACSMMQISYSAAWNMLNHVEDELGFPLVSRNRGGCAGSGSVLTEKGRELMAAYDGYCEQLKQAATELYGAFLGPVLETN